MKQTRSKYSDISAILYREFLKNDSALSSLTRARTLAEPSVGPLVASKDAERAGRQAHLQQAQADFHPLPFDAPAARIFGGVAFIAASSGS